MKQQEYDQHYSKPNTDFFIDSLYFKMCVIRVINKIPRTKNTQTALKRSSAFNKIFFFKPIIMCCDWVKKV